MDLIIHHPPNFTTSDNKNIFIMKIRKKQYFLAGYLCFYKTAIYANK
jgi:hypothetical protein